MELEWNIFPHFTTFQTLGQIQKMMGEIQCDPEEFTGRIIFMSMFNDIEWGFDFDFGDDSHRHDARHVTSQFSL